MMFRLFSGTLGYRLVGGRRARRSSVGSGAGPRWVGRGLAGVASRSARTGRHQARRRTTEAAGAPRSATGPPPRGRGARPGPPSRGGRPARRGRRSARRGPGARPPGRRNPPRPARRTGHVDTGRAGGRAGARRCGLCGPGPPGPGARRPQARPRRLHRRGGSGPGRPRVGLGHRPGPGGRSGTPAYLDPAVAPRGPSARSSEVFALAVVAYEVLTGRLPHRGDPAHVLAAAAAGSHRSLRSWPGCPAAVADVVERGLDPDPEARRPARPSSVAALRAAVAAHEVVLPRAGSHGAARRPARRPPAPPPRSASARRRPSPRRSGERTGAVVPGRPGGEPRPGGGRGWSWPPARPSRGAGGPGPAARRCPVRPPSCRRRLRAR